MAVIVPLPTRARTGSALQKSKSNIVKAHCSIRLAARPQRRLCRQISFFYVELKLSGGESEPDRYCTLVQNCRDNLGTVECGLWTSSEPAWAWFSTPGSLVTRGAQHTEPDQFRLCREMCILLLELCCGRPFCYGDDVILCWCWADADTSGCSLHVMLLLLVIMQWLWQASLVSSGRPVIGQRKSSAPLSAPSSPSNRPGAFMPKLAENGSVRFAWHWRIDMNDCVSLCSHDIVKISSNFTVLVRSAGVFFRSSVLRYLPLPEHVTSAPSVAVFRSRLKTSVWHIISRPSVIVYACAVTRGCFRTL